MDTFFRSYLFSYIFIVGLPLGCLGIALLHFLMGGRWGFTIRRIVIAGARTIWLGALLFVPLLLGLDWLYPWTEPEAVTEGHGFNPAYLNVPFFIIRAVIYFAVWSGMAWLLTRMAEKTNIESDPMAQRRLQRLSSFGLIVLVLTVTFAMIDWVMSLYENWYSAIFGLLMVAGFVLNALSFALLIRPILMRKEGKGAYSIPPPVFRDLGAILFTSVMMWAYLHFSQYLIIWGGNIPREAAWYAARNTGGWEFLTIFLIIFQFALPFAALLSVRVKENPVLLAALGAIILATGLLQTFWLVMPAFYPGTLTVSFFDILLPLVLSALWIAAFLFHFRRTPASFDYESLSMESSQERRTVG
ncbi:MAG: hypothetical protein EHM41_12890 [Chloroflexi bacterium]|nr:MAG: hypothetical protein EHM41_12890 [Chloroflexota bacterium]